MEEITTQKSPPSPNSPSISIQNDLAALSLSSETNNSAALNVSEERETEQIHYDDDGDNESVEENGEKKEEIDDHNHNDDGDENGDDDDDRKRIQFPVRDGVEDCSYYMRTGLCKFGVYCKFNHPPLTKFPQNAKVKRKEDSCDIAPENLREKNDLVEKGARFDCKYFERPGGCKWGEACKFNHNKKTATTSELNFMGLPVRPGEKECPYYMRNSSCKFGASCRFNHPDPASVGGFDSLSSYSNGGTVSSPNASQPTRKPWSPPSAVNENSAYLPLMFPPTQHVPPRPEWTGYQAPVYPPRNMHTAPTYRNRPPSHQQQHNFVDEFPERPGQPECSFFLKTGDCKYKSACKFHHPRNDSKNSSSFSLSELGLPLRPGESICSYYSRYGICKYGPSCKYDHPVNYAPSAVDMTSSFGHSMINNHAMAAGS